MRKRNTFCNDREKQMDSERKEAQRKRKSIKSYMG